MKVSKEQFAENRQKILAAAVHAFKEQGIDAASVAEIMKAAGLTHGGFYGHFKSKDDLFAQACGHSMGAVVEDRRDVAAYAKSYLSARHRSDVGGGCIFAALGGEAPRQSAEARHALTANLQTLLARLAANQPGDDAAERRAEAIAGFSTMLGGMLLARIVDDPALSDEVLAANLRACALIGAH